MLSTCQIQVGTTFRHVAGGAIYIVVGEPTFHLPDLVRVPSMLRTTLNPIWRHAMPRMFSLREIQLSPAPLP